MTALLIFLGTLLFFIIVVCLTGWYGLALASEAQVAQEERED